MGTKQSRVGSVTIDGIIRPVWKGWWYTLANVKANRRKAGRVNVTGVAKVQPLLLVGSTWLELEGILGCGRLEPSAGEYSVGGVGY